MRVMDWSSDVCSSDLPLWCLCHGRHDQRHNPENERKGCAYVGRGGATDRRARCQGADKRQEKPGRKEKACCEEGSRKEGFCQEGEGELGHSRPPRPADVKPKIGRASCRERVCQYV